MSLKSTISSIKLFLVSLFISSLMFSCSNENTKITEKQSEAFYDYAYPLVMMKISQDAMLTSPLRKGDDVNKFIMFKKLAQPENTAVVLGNRNTLYCVGWVDLSEGPVLFEIPDMNKRYYVMPLIDAWTNTFKSFGSRTTGQKAQKYFLTLSSYNGKVPDGYERVNCPTSMVWITGRIQADNDADALVANKLQDEYILRPYTARVNKYKPTFQAMKVKKPVPFSLAMDTETFYTTFFDMLRTNPPAAADAAFLKDYSFFKKNVSYNDLDEATKATLKAGLEKSTKKFLGIFYKGNEQKTAWDFKIEDMGDWGVDYSRRAYYAVWGIGANIPQDAVYGVSQLDGDLKQLEGTNIYKISFPPNGTPEVGGFWSITAYNNEGYLEANTEKRYASGSNMDIKYNKDGSLDLYLSSKQPKGVSDYNWIPTPKGTFKILFRMYWPKESILDGSYQLPNIKKID
ncbi:DUF1254 domain-containing protein [Flammeovirga kamogawensis]|uniref:DUF1254 domain-containing protein n=1 Tax=Flammeovirga kamogawensis TaxID=373891 RepID=A0ABX8H2E5_9BACT|nr:DUF1254 domain-containing protein [Flammeovirga kamogawensis]MBB6460267.1 hypothetical protein [Flammeovirga kamogawensis]QWG10078.1 DUF1254 domain-containing protein [Flammeovirga kamogawensis]TRX65585.1 DUF1254 domain-containing protein [Flammeovirga kamogawensis]